MPLAYLPAAALIKRVPIGYNLYYRRIAWDDEGATPSVDLDVYFTVRTFLPFLMRKVQTQSFNAGQCDAFSAIDFMPGRTLLKTVLAHCPHTHLSGPLGK